MLSRLATKLRKLRLGPAYRHQAHLPAGFKLQRHGDAHDVRWLNQHLGSIKSYQRLKNAYRGTCFVVGAGPSLKELDIARIAAFDAITLNGAILKYTQAGLAPRHHLMMDHKAFKEHYEYARAGIDSGAQCFFPYLGIAKICEEESALISRPNIHLIEAIDKKYDQPRLEPSEFFRAHRDTQGIYLSGQHPDRRGTIGFNYGENHGFFTSNTVAVPAVQLACYLGYSTIFLVGLELGFSGQTHFYDQKVIASNDLMDNYDPDIKVCFELARQAAGEHGFELYNLTPQSLLSADIVPRMRFDDALELLAGSKHEA